MKDHKKGATKQWTDKELGILTLQEVRERVEAREARDPYREYLSDASETPDGAVKLSWLDLVAMSPGLAGLFEKASSFTDDQTRNSFCPNRIWDTQLKPQLCLLVGEDAIGTPPAMRSSAAYDLAYDKCYDALPPCRNCMCPSFDLPA